MTSWRDRLSALAREWLPAEPAAAWAGLFRPGIRLVSAEAGPRVGRIGGAPMMPAELAWPEWPGCGPLDFLASVDCAALPRGFLSTPLPEAGTLLFFYFDGDRRVSDHIPALGDIEASRVVHVPAGVPVVERAAPDGVVPYPARDLFGDVVATAPQSGHILLDQTETASGESLAEAVETVSLPGDYVDTEVFGQLVWQAHEKARATRSAGSPTRSRTRWRTRSPRRCSGTTGTPGWPRRRPTGCCSPRSTATTKPT